MDSRIILIGCLLFVMSASHPIVKDPENPGCPIKCFSQDCSQILENNPSAQSGNYVIQPSDGRPEFTVYCDMKEDGGWTVIQRREDVLVNFYRNWTEYKTGFGNVHTEFWLGNEQIHRITSDGDFELLVEMTDHLDEIKFARYSHFRIGTEWSNYTIRVNGYTGTAGDSLANQNGQQFSTYDTDNDKYSANCAEKYKGAWWYNNCYKSNLNGLYLTPGPIPSGKTHNGIIWHHFKSTDAYSLKKTVMMVKRAP
ncbi:fibrinogen-like protein A [Antedon mediterranea]|uniref:fibrinogen-like protein A n=1 Tax=Antedon mediterranea TaxID=105859 RepID=UPI003AF4E6D8